MNFTWLRTFNWLIKLLIDWANEIQKQVLTKIETKKKTKERVDKKRKKATKLKKKEEKEVTEG